MNKVFDFNNMPERRLYVRQCLVLQQHMDVGYAVQMVKENMAHNIAKMILENKEIFWERSVDRMGLVTLEYGADVVVLTREELVEVQRESFRKGAQHAQGYMTTWGVA